MFKILLVDDQSLWTDLLSKVFTDHPTIQVVGSVASSRDLWEALKQQQPDLILLDLYLGDEINDLSLALQLKRLYPVMRVVMLTSANHNARLIQQANQSGLDGYLSKHITEAAFVDLLLKAEKGERIFSDDIKDVLVQVNKSGLPQLTPREKEILARVGAGMKRASIIQDLKMRSTNTYDAHVQHIKDKFGVKSTSELLRKAAELGYI